VTASERIDWESHSRPKNELAIGVDIFAYELTGNTLVDIGASGGVGLGLALKEVSKFWAEDLRRIAGRCIISPCMLAKELAIYEQETNLRE